MNALFWISTLYLAEGLPYIAVNTLSVIMYKNMGISNAEIAFFTGWLYLPWVIKPFWSPFVDILRTKRWWVLFTQISIALAFGLLALLLPGSLAFKSSLIIFWIIGFLSATHDIAADGSVMVSKIAGNNGTVTIECQQTSAIHKWLSAWFNALWQLPTSEWASTSMTLRNTATGTRHIISGISPQKEPDTPYQSQGQRVSWTLMCAEVTNLPI